MRPHIALPMGDPAGIGPEVVLKALASPETQALDAHFTVIGDRLAIDAVSSSQLALRWESATEFSLDGYRVTWMAPSNPLSALILGQSSAETGRVCYAYAELAVDGVINGRFDAIAAAPHTEASVNAAGIPFSGYPSLLARKVVSKRPIQLLLIGGHLAVIHVTLHQSLASAITALTTQKILDAISLANQFYQQITESPRLAVCGLNPHAGEGGLFGSEDMEIIAPAVKQAQSMGIDVIGPISPDCLFHRQDFECIVAMYHDQGHIPVKTIAPRSSIALSIGSDVLFGTVAHGSALDIAGCNCADPAAFSRLVTEITRMAQSKIQQRHKNK